MSTEALIKKWERNMEKVVEADKKAKEAGILTGRYIKEPYADGYAIYQIIRENKKSVRIRVVTDIGDDWVLPYFGEEATIDKEYAISNIHGRDRLEALFQSKKND